MSDGNNEYYTEERCHILELHNDEADPGVSLARARVEPGVTTRWHAVAGTVERYLIISGTGVAEVGDNEPLELSSGDSLVIPAGIRQRIRNTGDDDLIFHCICTPRFEWGNYQAFE